MSYPNMREIITVSLRQYRGHIGFEWPPRFIEELMSLSCWGSADQKVETIARRIDEVMAQMNGLYTDGAGI